MKRIKGPSGERLWIEADEIEAITEAALRAAGLFPSDPDGPVDIEALVEVHLEAIVDYAGDLPDTVLGYTLFGSPHRVVVNRLLSDLALAENASLGLRGRWRATVAHEAAHILLHAGLARTPLVTPHESGQSIDAIADERPGSDWREVQANMGMAALLMPRGPFLAEARRVLESQPIFLPLRPEALQAERLVSILAHQFETSREATGWRLRNLGWLAVSGNRAAV